MGRSRKDTADQCLSMGVRWSRRQDYLKSENKGALGLLLWPVVLNNRNVLRLFAPALIQLCVSIRKQGGSLRPEMELCVQKLM